jgi:hypothetical protein
MPFSGKTTAPQVNMEPLVGHGFCQTDTVQPGIEPHCEIRGDPQAVVASERFIDMNENILDGHDAPPRQVSFAVRHALFEAALSAVR